MVTQHSMDAQWRGPDAAVGVGVALVIAAVGALGGSTIGQPVAMGVGGFLWGLVLSGGASLVRRHGSWVSPVANASLFAGAIVAGILAGWSVLDLSMQTAVIHGSPQSFGIFLRDPIESVLLYGLLLLNTSLEWLFIPAALLLNWHAPRRRMLLVALAVVYYAMRVWTYAYFVPTIFDWGGLPAGQPFSAQQIAEFTTWVDLSWVRGVADLFLFIAFLAAVASPSRRAVQPGANRQRVGRTMQV